ncbi:hypothetical protein D3C80_797460 [compost metagenome]
MVEEVQPGAGVVLKIALGQASPELGRAQRAGEVGGAVAEHPVDFFATRLGDGVDGLAYLAFPGLTGEHARHAGLAGEQRLGLGVADHLGKIQRRVVVAHAVEHLAVQAGFGIALAQLAEQDLPGLGQQRRINLDAPVRMRRQVLGIKLPEVGHQALPECRRGVLQGCAQEGRVGLFRLRHHQVGLQLFVGAGGPFGPFGAVRRQLDQDAELRLQVGRHRVAQQAVIGLGVAWPEEVEQGLVLIEAEALVPGRPLGSAVIQAPQFAHQIIECQQLCIARLRLLQGNQHSFNVGDLRAVADERQQQAGAPQQRHTQGQRVADAAGGPTQAANVSAFVIEHALPGRVDWPIMGQIAAVASRHWQAEPQPAQRDAPGQFTEQGGQRLAPAGDALDLQIARQAYKKIMVHYAVHLRPALLAQGRQ